MKKLLKGMLICAAMTIGMIIPVHAQTVVQPGESIAEALYNDPGKSVRLVAGGTYYLSDPLDLDGGETIDATGATIVVGYEIARNNWADTGYNSSANITMRGGKWICSSYNPGGLTTSTIKFAHAKNIVLDGMDIECTNYDHHTIELVACQNVTIQNCTILGQGSAKAGSIEEMVQIDVASPRTAPWLSRELQNGLCCDNVLVQNCTIVGNRAVCANFPKNSPEYKNNFHTNIRIIGNRLTGTQAEGLALFNTVNGEIKNNVIKSMRPGKSNSYTDGVQLSMFGVNSNYKPGNWTITGNTITGGREALLVSSHSKQRYGKVTVTDNITYTKSGAKRGIVVGSAKKVVKARNTLYGIDEKGNVTSTAKEKAGKKTSKKTAKKSGKVATKTLSVSGGKSITLKKKKTYKIKTAVTPKNTTDKLKFKSSNKKVATVSSKGVIKAKKKGKATITVTSGKKKVKITVKVK